DGEALGGGLRGAAAYVRGPRDRGARRVGSAALRRGAGATRCDGADVHGADASSALPSLFFPPVIGYLPSMKGVEADAIGKSFGRVRVLRDLALRVESGDAIALFGPNGAGKSTLLRICATLYEPTTGTLALFGSRRRSAEIRRRIGLLSHQS